MVMSLKKICFLLADLRNVGPTRQTLNIIKYSGAKDSCVVLTLFEEPTESLVGLYYENNIKVECLHLSRKTFVVNAVNRIAKFCEKEKIEIIHSYGVKPDVVAYLTAKKKGIKHIITLRNFPVEDLSGRMNPWIGKFIAHIHLYVLKRCKYLIACSETIARKMRNSYGVDIRAIQNGVDTELFQAQGNVLRKDLLKQYQIEGIKKIFICTNSFIPRKHNGEIAEAFVGAKLQNALLLFLGNGPLLDELKKKYKVFSNILFIGKQKDVSAYLRSADVFVSASDSEGLPNAVIESLACGCPVVLSDISQHREILDEVPDCGRLFPLHDVDSLSLIMQKCLLDQINFSDVALSVNKSPFTMKRMGLSYKLYYEGVFDA